MANISSELLPTPEALGYSGLTKNTLKKYSLLADFNGEKLQRVTLDGTHYYNKASLDRLLAFLGRKPGYVIPRDTRKPKAIRGSQQATHDIDQGFEVEDGEEDAPTGIPPASAPKTADELYKLLGVNHTTPVKQIVAGLQKYIIDVVLRNGVLDTYVNDLQSHDWRARHGAADKLLALVMPKMKSTEVVHQESQEKVERQERALKLFEDIKQQIAASRRPLPSSGLIEVKTIEIDQEDAEILQEI